MGSSTTPRTRAGATFAYYAAFVGLGLTSAALGASLPRLADNTGSTTAQISFLFTAGAAGYMIGSTQIGRWYDRQSGHPLIAGALVALVALMAIVPLVRLLWLLILVYLMVGVAQGILDVGCNTLLVWTHGARIGPTMNGLHLCFGIGAFICPVIMAQVLRGTGSITLGFWGIAVLLTPPALALARLPSPGSGQQVGAQVECAAPRWMIALFAVFFFLFVGAEHTLGGWTATYAISTGLGTEATAAYLTSAFWGAFTLGRLLAIPLAAWVQPRWMLLGDIVICLLSVLAMAIWSGSPVAIWGGVIGAGLTIAPIFATTMALAETMLSITGKVTSWFFIGVSSGSLVMPWLTGQLFEAVGPNVLIYAEVVDLVLGLVILFALLAATSGRTRQPTQPATAPPVGVAA